MYVIGCKQVGHTFKECPYNNDPVCVPCPEADETTQSNTTTTHSDDADNNPPPSAVNPKGGIYRNTPPR